MNRATITMISASLAVSLGCGDDPIPPRVRVAHLAPGAPGFSVHADDDLVPLVDSLAFGESTDYLRVPSGTQSIRIGPAGAGPDAALITLDQFFLFEGQEYTVVAFGTGDPDDAFPLEGALFADAVPAPPEGTVALRPIHAVPGVAEVDVYALGGGPPLLLIDDLSYGAPGGYASVSEEYDSIGLDLDDDVVIDVRFLLDLTVPGRVWTAFLSVDLQGAPVLIAQGDDGTSVTVSQVPQ